MQNNLMLTAAYYTVLHLALQYPFLSKMMYSSNPTRMRIDLPYEKRYLVLS